MATRMPFGSLYPCSFIVYYKTWIIIRNTEVTIRLYVIVLTKAMVSMMGNGCM